MKTRLINFVVSEKLHDEFERICRANAITVDAVLIRAMERFIQPDEDNERESDAND